MRIRGFGRGMSDGLHIIKCVSCGKVLCEANGEVKKICPKCKTVNHVVVTSMGLYYIGMDLSTRKDYAVLK